MTPAADPTSADTSALSVRFWGVRGTIPVTGPHVARYGGNTSCIELRCGDRLLILDCGSGLRALGDALQKEGRPVDADILCSHFHLDHLIGLPFFAPAYDPANRFRLWAARQADGGDLERALHRLMSPPLLPMTPAIWRAKMEYRAFAPGETLAPRPAIAVRTAPLNHPDGATGYRIDYAGKALAYATDTEHRRGAADSAILALVARADLLIYDCTYTDEEWRDRVGWGHSTWQEAVRIADAADVKRLVIFHHDPAHDDDFMDRVAADAAAARPGTLVAREGTAVTV